LWILPTKKIAAVPQGNATAEELIIPCIKDAASIMPESDRLIKLQPLGQITQLS
jgi:hypothetical protein